MRKDIPQIGMIYQILNQDGEHDLKKIAQEYHEHQCFLEQSEQWTYDRYLEYSSSANAHVYTTPSSYKKCSVWSINHYLGLNRHPYVIEKAKQALDLYGTGCGTSAMSGGHSKIHKALQKRFAKVFGKEESLLFSTGFTANSGAISSLCKNQHTLAIIDKNCHASIIQGCKAGNSKFISFKHNSIVDLEKKLKRFSNQYSNLLVIVESAYSMEGDVAPLEEIVALKKHYNFLLYVDEAHTFGFYGNQGSGLCNALQISDQVDFIMTTLSKSTASIGGVVATSKEFASFLRWSAPYLFQASIPSVDAIIADACLDLIGNHSDIVDSLWKKSNYLRNGLVRLGFDVGNSQTPIIPLYVKDPEILKAMEKELYEQGVFTVAVQYPAVKSSEVRFRFIVNNSHTFDDIDQLISILNVLGKKYGIIDSIKPDQPVEVALEEEVYS